MDRGQLPVTLIEAALGVLLLFGVTLTFVAAPPPAGTAEAQLDAYAADAATLLASEPPSHGDQSRLSEMLRSKARFQREADTLERRVERILPANVLYRVETEHGTVGHPPPDGVPMGTATVTTTGGELTIRVWYA
ncbi:MAG: hypothetical protein ABEH61_00940 [Haloarculaceae archaeon]